jgi:hypothetical protein
MATQIVDSRGRPYPGEARAYAICRFPYGQSRLMTELDKLKLAPEPGIFMGMRFGACPLVDIEGKTPSGNEGGLSLHSLAQKGLTNGATFMVMATVAGASGEAIAYELRYILSLLQNGWDVAAKKADRALQKHGIYYGDGNTLIEYPPDAKSRMPAFVPRCERQRTNA